MTDCNQDLLPQARANVAERQTPANARAIIAGQWDPIFKDGKCIAGTLVQAEIERLLREPLIMEGAE